MNDGPSSRVRAPLELWLRLGLLAALLVTGLVLARTTSLGDLLDRDRLVALLDQLRSLWWAPLLVVGGHALLAVLGLPSGALMLGGALFGSLLGSVYNTAGLVVGAAASYLVAKTLGRGFVVQVAGKRLKRAERIFRRHGFWPLVQTRFLPLPGPVVNFGAALAGVPLPAFLVASVLGLVPSTVIHTHFMAQLLPGSGGSTSRTLAFYAASLLILNLIVGVPWLVGQRRRRSRYRELVASRAAARQRAAVVLVVLAMVASLTGCASVGDLEPVDLEAPGWTVWSGQAVWRPAGDLPTLAGEVLLARHQSGDVLVSLSKPPLPIFTAQTAGGEWRIDSVERGRAYSGRGRPPGRFVWFRLPDIFEGEAPPGSWELLIAGPGEWVLENRKSGERIRVVLDG